MAVVINEFEVVPAATPAATAAAKDAPAPKGDPREVQRMLRLEARRAFRVRAC